MQKDKILIIGGYGAVGKVISRQLAKIYPGRIIIAGRSLSKAQKSAAATGNGALPLQLDISGKNYADIPGDVMLVVMCLDLSQMDWVRYFIENRIHYIDITANQSIMQKLETFHDLAHQHHVSILLSIGLAPGLTNILAQNIISKSGKNTIKTLDIFILLGLGEAHGEEAYKWTFDHIHHKYKLPGRDKAYNSFSQGKSSDLAGRRKFYLFDFADQHILGRQYPGMDIKTRLAFDLRWVTKLAAVMRKCGVSVLYKWPWSQHILIQALKKRQIGSELFGIKVTAALTDGKIISSQVTGKKQGHTTAHVTAAIASLMIQEKIKPGVWHINEWLEDPVDFLKMLNTSLPDLQIDWP